ncbi:potassium/proton antiporter [soil metagenome]
MTAGLPIDGAILIGASLLVVGVLVVGFSDRLRLPASLLSLGLGMLFGSDVLGLVRLDDAALVRDISVIALIVILFEGGLTTKPSALRETGAPGFALASVGVVLTAGVTAVAAHFLLGTGWETALLLGAVVASTDAAVVFDLLRRAPLPRRLAGVLEVESGANDPVAILLTIGLVETFLHGSSVVDWLEFGTVQLVGGLAVGAAFGLAGSKILSMRLRSQGLYPLLASGIAGLTYAVAAGVSASGFLAVYVCGLIVGARVPRQRRVIRSFYASLANGADIALFLILGLLVFPSRLGEVALTGLALTAILVLVARPVAVAVSLLPFRLPWREQAWLSWAGLRGAVPIVLATFHATAGLAAGETIFDIVFFVVVTSMLLQGTTVMPLARRLGLVTDHPAWQSIAEAVPLDDADVDLVEIVVTADLPLIGSRLDEMPTGPGMQVTIVIRGHRTVIPSGSTVFEEGDVVMLAVDRERAGVSDATAWARGETSEGRDSGPADPPGR